MNIGTWQVIHLKTFSTFRHRIKRAITKWDMNGHTLLAVPERKLLLDITISMDIELNPGPQEKLLDSSKISNDLPSGLRVTHWNLNSIAPTPNNTKLDELKLLLKSPGRETHFLGITETWLNDSFKNSHLKIPGYKIERIDRTEKLPSDKIIGGGIVTYIQQDLPYTRRTDLESQDIASLWIQLCPP